MVDYSMIKKSILRPYKTILLYISLENEPSTVTLIEDLLVSSTTVLCPIEQKGEPCIAQLKESSILWSRWILPNEEIHFYTWLIDVVLVPWLAFDKSWVRLWHGWWRYDKFFSKHPEPYKVWVCFEEQILPQWKIPVDDWDVSMDSMIVL